MDWLQYGSPNGAFLTAVSSAQIRWQNIQGRVFYSHDFPFSGFYESHVIQELLSTCAINLPAPFELVLHRLVGPIICSMLPHFLGKAIEGYLSLLQLWSSYFFHVVLVSLLLSLLLLFLPFDSGSHYMAPVGSELTVELKLAPNSQKFSCPSLPTF